ncbi:MAG: alpha/beta fold hydrolase [Propionicimonas sp.]
MLSDQRGVHRSHPWVRVAIGGLAGLLCSLSALLALDAERSIALDSPDPPTTSVVDHSITYATYPEREAKVHTVDAPLVERCRQSSFVVVSFSGTGLEASQYQANVIQRPVEDLGGCVMYHWYGHSYDSAASARSIAEAIRQVTPDGERKRVVFLGASFGGIAAEAIAADPVVVESRVIDLVRIIMIATPVDMNDVLQDVFGVPVPLIKDIRVAIPHFGGLVVLGNAINGQRQRGQLLDPAEWKNTFVNAAKTRPVLLWSELERLRQGMVWIRSDVRVDYLGSPDSELTVDTDKAYARVENLVIAETRYFQLHDGGHDMGWLEATAGTYNEKLVPIFKEMFGPA